MPRTKIAWVIAAAHMLLAIWFASVTPYLHQGILLGQRDATGQPQRIVDVGAPDELQHVVYVARLADGQGFPVFQPGSSDIQYTYQSHQPPLYYGIAAGYSKLVGSFESPDAGLKARFLNVLIGGCTVLGVFWLGWHTTRSNLLSLGAAGFAALLPMNCALSGAVSNDPLLFCLCTWSLEICALALRTHWCLGKALRLGLLMGFAVLTKTTALALFPVVAFAMLGAWPLRGERAIRSEALATFTVAILMALPWWLRNQSLYGDPFALKAFNQAFTGSAQTSQILGGIVATGGSPLDYWLNMFGWWTVRSLLGVFGYMDIFLNEHGTPFTGPGAPNTIYRLWMAFLAVCAIGWVISLKKPREVFPARYVNMAFFAVIALLFLKFNLQYFQAQARYLIPAIGPLSVGIAISLAALAKDKTKLALSVSLAALALLDIYSLQRLPAEFARRDTGPANYKFVDGIPQG
ncbi:MAG: hypothetical protein JSS72_10500 [Armatimonadetes bacterium]|nr:hypothetical protein [Armatimonadota bacterium]